MTEAPAATVFDTHCHLQFPGLAEGAEELVERAARAGVRGMLTLGTDLEDSRRAMDLAAGLPGVRAACGVHPGESGSVDPDDGAAELFRMALEPSAVAVGEAGLDLHHRRVELPVQAEWLRRQSGIARALNLPLVVHSRKAERECLDVLGESPGHPVVMHCYTGPDEVALESARRGWWVGFAGPLSYSGNGRLRKLAGRLPADRIVVETDAPFLAPQPVRGRTNEPAFVVHTARAASRAMGLEPDAGMDLLWKSSLRLLGLGENARTDPLYVLGENVYVNLTGRCDNDCAFCIRRRKPGLGGYHLRHSGEMDADRLRLAMRLLRPSDFREVVFCGYGEPTMRPELLRELAAAASAGGGRVRLNTNGLATGRIGREGARRMLEPFDSVSVSLNASGPEEYARVCRPGRPDAWSDLMDFLDLLAELPVDAAVTAVRDSGADLKATAALAERLGFPFRARGGS